MTHDYKSVLDALDKYMLINDKINFQSYNFKQKHAVQFLEFYKEEVCSALQLAQEFEQDKGNISDGYHTFNELYNHRHSLFCALTNAYPEKSWKSKLHSDGTMFDGWFIAGIQTKCGDATYHLPISWWINFEIDELPNAPEYDGHTSNDVVYRIKTLSPNKSNKKVRNENGNS